MLSPADKFSITSSPFWNISLLAIAWALTLSTSTLLTTVGPLSATYLGASKSLAAFTVGTFLIGAAVSSVPSGWLFRKYGRFGGFLMGCFCQFTGSAFGVLSMYTKELFWLYLGCLSIGLAQGLGQFYRFSAVEITPAEFKSRAVTYVLSGGIIAAFVGPTSANYTVHLIDKDYVGSYLMVAIFAILNCFVLCLVRFPPPKPSFEDKAVLSGSQTSSVSGTSVSGVQSNKDDAVINFKSPQQKPPRSTGEIVSQPLFILSCTIATLAHTIMVMLMSNVSVEMSNHGYSFAKSSLTLELHFVAMFSPGFVTGKLIERHGSFLVALVGGLLFAGSAVLLAVGTEEWNYIVGMLLVGVAWNFSFSAGTVMLTTSYRPSEATSVQAVNDFVLFTVAGAGSLLSGVIFAAYGWLALIYVVSVLMVLYLLLFLFTLRRRQEILEAEQRSLLHPDGDDDEEEDEEVDDAYNPPVKDSDNPLHNDQLNTADKGDDVRDRTFSDFINSFGGSANTNTNNTNNPAAAVSTSEVQSKKSRMHSTSRQNSRSNSRNPSFSGAPYASGRTKSTTSYFANTPVLLGFGGPSVVMTGEGGNGDMDDPQASLLNGPHRSISIVDIENADDDELRPLRSMSVA